MASDYHDYEPSDRFTAMHSDPLCSVCDKAKNDYRHAPLPEIHEFLPEPIVGRPGGGQLVECVICGEPQESGIHTPARGDIQ